MQATGVVAVLTLGVSGLAALVLSTDTPIRAADHGDSPAVRLDGRLDINDVYIFASPQTPTNTVMICTVSPLAGITGNTHFAPKAQYVFNLDTDGDAVEDQTYTVTFGKLEADGTQAMKVQGKGGDKFVAHGVSHTELALPNGGKVIANLYDDPFFFDLIAFKKGLAFDENNPRNFFRGLNTMAIVLEVPTAKLGATNVGLWCATRQGKKQIDRMGRPAINTALIPAPKKDAFNAGSPKDDVAKYHADVVASITGLGNGAQAEALANILLPDILTYDTTNPAGFFDALNGRKLDDDVIDKELKVLSGNLDASDFVGNDSTFKTEFPYLADKNP